MHARKIPWMAALLLLYAASVIDGYLTTLLGAELNPLLYPVFSRGGKTLVVFKVCLLPLFLMFGYYLEQQPQAQWARYAVFFIGGWYAAIICAELMQLVFA